MRIGVDPRNSNPKAENERQFVHRLLGLFVSTMSWLLRPLCRFACAFQVSWLLIFYVAPIIVRFCSAFPFIPRSTAKGYSGKLQAIPRQENKVTTTLNKDTQHHRIQLHLQPHPKGVEGPNGQQVDPSSQSHNLVSLKVTSWIPQLKGSSDFCRTRWCEKGSL